MLYGPFYIFKCPECPQTFSDMGIMSATGISKLYSDGQNKFSFDLNDHCRLMRCENCKSIYWKNELETIGTYTDYDNEEHQNLISKTKKISTPTIAQYFQAIKLKIYSDKDDLVYLRKKIWHSYNNRILSGKNIFTYKNEEKRWERNINQLLSLIKKNQKKKRGIKEISDSKKSLNYGNEIKWDENNYKILPFVRYSYKFKVKPPLNIERLYLIDLFLKKEHWIIEENLIQAELLRNLGKFNDSIKILNGIWRTGNKGIDEMKKKILEQCNNKNNFVVQIV
tara:strand:+ start:3418 stop:4260 length:843 start_codon:yes stop_codon:yes gene_type:complete